ncbi:MAG TPA: AraC family transcriptional regulator [Candidatus Paenibacillus intestinavium]|nr:AraC family transcriptional regulator [Candidatus Paenibacillus intestinavium]
MVKKPLLIKFLVSYIAILILPIAAIIAYYYPYSTAIVKDKASAWNMHVTEQLMNSMDIFTKYVYNLPAEIMQNREIKPYMAPENDYQKVIIAREMRKYNITDAFIENSLLYLKNIDYFFSKTGSAYTTDDFSNKGVGYVYEQWPAEQMVQELNYTTEPIVRSAESVYVPGGHKVNLLSFVLPMPLGGSNSPGSMLILVKESTILNMMQSSSDTYNGIFLITDDKQHCLVASIGCPTIIDSEFNQLLSLSDEQFANLHTITLNKEQYIVSRTTSDINQWNYIRLLPIAETIQDIRIIQFSTLILLIVIISITALIIYISLRYNYHPIRRLVVVSSKLFADESKTPKNEIETIHYALDQLSITKEKLDEQLQQTRPKMRDTILFQLVLGNFEHWEAFDSDAHLYNIKFSNEYITVVILSAESAVDSLAILQHCKAKFKLLEDGIIPYVLKSQYNHEIIIIISHQPMDSLHSFVSLLQQELHEVLKLDSLIGISLSHPKHNIKVFHYGYLQASRSIEQIRFQRTSTIVTYNDSQQPSTGVVSYQTELMQSLELAILKNDADRILALIQHIQTYMGGTGMPSHVIRTIYLNTMSILFNTLERFQQNNNTALHNIEFVFQNRYSLDQMLSIMTDTTNKLCEIITLTLPTSRKASSENILAFVDSHWHDSNLSLQFMADHFEMSVSNFSYHFKKTIGHNFKEYIDQLRIQHSIQYLKSCDEPIEAIALKVGYMNSSSFIRSFKKITGSTPGQYRDHMK